MNHARRLELALWGITAVLALLTAGALLREPSVRVGRIPPAELRGSAAAKVDAGEAPSEGVDAIVAGNIFSSTRAAPKTRYVPYGSDAESAGYAEDAVADVESFDASPDGTGVADAGVGGEPGVPRLYGTMLGPRGASAVIRLDPSSPEGRLYRVGDRAYGYEVVEIHARSVILSGPRGRIEVRLIPPEERTR